MSRPLVVAVLVLTLLILAFGMWSDATDNEFIWDDPIVLNQQLPYFDSLHNLLDPPKEIPQFGNTYFRPMIVLTYMLDEAVAKKYWPVDQRDVARRYTYHTSCVIYNAFNTLLVFWLGLVLHRAAGPRAGPPWGGLVGATLGALLFVVHPIHVESVAWMAGRSDVVCATFFILALIAVLSYRAAPRGWKLGAFGLAALGALLCKETATGLVFVLPLIDLALQPRAAQAVPELPAATRAERRRQARLAPPPQAAQRATALPLVLPYIVLAASLVTYFVLRARATRTGGSPPWTDDIPQRLLGSIWWMIRKAFWPPPQSAFVTEIPRDALSLLLAVVALAGFAWWLVTRFRRRAAGVGSARELIAAGIFFAAMAPSLAIAVRRISETPLAERYLYLPSIGLCLLAGFALERLAARLPASGTLQVGAAALLALVIAVPAGMTSVQRQRIWQNNFSFWSDMIQKAPNEGIPHLHMGMTWSELVDRTKDAKAWAENEHKAIAEYELALKTYDDAEGRTKANNNMGSSYMALGDLAKAIECFKAALAEDPKYPTPHYNWGLGLHRAALNEQDPSRRDKLINEAIFHYRQAIQLNPRYVKALMQYGSLLVAIGQREEGLATLQRAVALAPASAEGRYAQQIIDKNKATSASGQPPAKP